MSNQIKYSPTIDPGSKTHPIVVNNSHPTHPDRQLISPPQKNKTGRHLFCCLLGALGILFVILFFVYWFAPQRTTILILGIDHAPSKSYLGRSDTIILTTFTSLKPYMGMLSIPRDLWVNIPGFGENRINTAHFFAETQKPGSGPMVSIDTIQQNFNIRVNYYVRIRFEGVKDIIDAMGGVNVNLLEPMAGYPAGFHHLTGNKALAFARDRQGTDDFFRMEQGQLLIKAIIQQLIKPSSILIMPKVFLTIYRSIDSNLPLWHVPRLLMTYLLLGKNGIDNRIISREMATPYITSQGANVLIPNWEVISKITTEMFGQ